MVGQGGGGRGRGGGGGREPPVGRGAASLGLVVGRRLVAQRVALGDWRQVPHGERKLGVLLVLDGQTGELTQQAHGALDHT